MAGAFSTALVRLFDRFLIVGDPPDSEESVSLTLDRVLLKVGIVMWVVGCKVCPPYPRYVHNLIKDVTKIQRTKDSGRSLLNPPLVQDFPEL